ncbi:MAG TPA: cytochrome c oxidase subunit II [Pseudolabrys sp.]|jgi:cytochrome c oxidase subunit 2|nr:cytochrome c oxidase subunit II [Pseudolabrys sp.]
MNISAYTAEASRYAGRVDTIFYSLSAVSILIVILVFGLVIGFSVRYRRGSKAPREPLPMMTRHEVEIGWTVATVFLFLFIFGWAATAQLTALQPPKHALHMHVLAKQWMWKIQQPNGLIEFNEAHVPEGKEVVLSMTSQDVIHDFWVPALRIKQDVLPGQYTYLWFNADRPGTYGLLCAEYCGTGHSRMTGRFIIMKPAAYAKWLAAQPQTVGLAQEGKALFQSLGCNGCHAKTSTVHAPDLDGIFNRRVHLQDGRTVIANEKYLRDSILLPKQDVVAGFKPVMPSFKGMIDESDMVKLLAYLKSLSVNGEANK